MNGLGIYDLEKGHNTMDTKKWRDHQKRYGSNNVSRGFGKFTWRYSNMPFLYAFFTIIAGGIMAADNLLYEYEYWYAQGSAMILMVGIAALVFGCGKPRLSKLQETLDAERAAKPVYDKPATVTRNGI